jgi:hypothetical protein
MQGQCRAEETLVTDSPDIVTTARYCVELVVILLLNVGAWHMRPRGSVPMQRQRPAEPITVISDSPNIVAAANHCQEIVPPKARIRAWHDRPCASIPMQYQGPRHLEALLESVVVARCPDVVATAAYSEKKVAECTNIWAWHHRPRAAVPMHRQGDGATAVAIFSHGPNVVAATGHSVE